MRAPWPALGTLVFSILVPGFVAIWLPIRLRGHGQPPATIARVAGWLVLAAGIALYLFCASRFVHAGGTPAPIAPTRDLVSRGVYRYIRNPMYVSVLLAIFGQALAYGSWRVAIYGVVAWCLMFLFVLLYEEPTLERQFREPYREYCERVPRWLPRLRRIPPEK